MNEFFVAIGWAIIVSKFVALIALLFFSKQGVKEMLTGFPSKDWREQVEHSLLIVTAVSFGFHFLGRFISDAILSASIDPAAKRQLYYLFFALYEVIYVALIVKLHMMRDCVFARYSRFVCFLSAAMATLLMARYVDRVILEADLLRNVFKYCVAGINVATLLVIGAYPAFRVFNLVPSKRWV